MAHRMVLLFSLTKSTTLYSVCVCSKASTSLLVCHTSVIPFITQFSMMKRHRIAQISHSSFNSRGSAKSIQLRQSYILWANIIVATAASRSISASQGLLEGLTLQLALSFVIFFTQLSWQAYKCLTMNASEPRTIPSGGSFMLNICIDRGLGVSNVHDFVLV